VYRIPRSEHVSSTVAVVFPTKAPQRLTKVVREDPDCVVKSVPLPHAPAWRGGTTDGGVVATLHGLEVALTVRDADIDVVCGALEHLPEGELKDELLGRLQSAKYARLWACPDAVAL